MHLARQGTWRARRLEAPRCAPTRGALSRSACSARRPSRPFAYQRGPTALRRARPRADRPHGVRVPRVVHAIVREVGAWCFARVAVRVAGAPASYAWSSATPRWRCPPRRPAVRGKSGRSGRQGSGRSSSKSRLWARLETRSPRRRSPRTSSGTASTGSLGSSERKHEAPRETGAHPGLPFLFS